MARTRGASVTFQDDGVLLGKGGEPIPTNPRAPAMLDRQGAYISPAAQNLVTPKNIPGNKVFHGPGAEPVAIQPQITGYRADPKSWARDMDGWELAMLFDLALRHDPDDLADGFAVTVTVDEFNRLGGNLRRHFMAVRGKPLAAFAAIEVAPASGAMSAPPEAPTPMPWSASHETKIGRVRDIVDQYLEQHGPTHRSTLVRVLNEAGLNEGVKNPITSFATSMSTLREYFVSDGQGTFRRREGEEVAEPG